MDTIGFKYELCGKYSRRKTKNRRAQIQNMENLIGANFIILELIISCTISDTNKYFSLSGSLSGFNFIRVLPCQPGFSWVSTSTLAESSHSTSRSLSPSFWPSHHSSWHKKLYFWSQTILQRSRIRSSWIWKFRIKNLIVFFSAEVTDLPLLPWLVTGQ